MRVLFTGGGGAGTQALWDLLSPSYDVHFCDPDLRRIPPVVPDDHAHPIPMASDPRFLDDMSQLCRDLRVDILVPGVDEELELIASQRDILHPTNVLLPDFAFVGTMLDKFSFVQALAGAGIRVPRTLPLGLSASWGLFPAIIKPRRGRGSRGVFVVADAESLAEQRELHRADADLFVVQELVVGDEYTVQVMVNSTGSLRAVFPVHVLGKRGITISAVAKPHPSVLAVCERIHEAAGSTGCYNVQGIVDGAGVFVPFEINPRISTTMCLAVAAGLDPLQLCLDSVRDEPLVAFTSGIRLERYWANEIVRPGDDDRGRLR